MQPSFVIYCLSLTRVALVFRCLCRSLRTTGSQEGGEGKREIGLQRVSVPVNHRSEGGVRVGTVVNTKPRLGPDNILLG